MAQYYNIAIQISHCEDQTEVEFEYASSTPSSRGPQNLVALFLQVLTDVIYSPGRSASQLSLISQQYLGLECNGPGDPSFMWA